ncbi:regulatory protein RecX [Tenggerimyces flavus]|uniref:Regulatory protein RecX n=1 Tax=Tenggerimyces flavus TaxID=1708749 RepID=A0ABV7YFR4_9ACTN|nr:regulatory protein RecX [Tenggerimyces flavus]MBM7786993.1 regulatory protein [Tenggerimyces flavus]
MAGRKFSDRRARAKAAPPDELDEKLQSDPAAVARSVVLRQLALQPRTRAELAKALERKGVPDEVAEEVLSRFGDVGLIDDAAFAQSWVESRHAGRGLAKRALAYELRKRGVDDQDVNEAVDQLAPETELATARALVAKKLRSTQQLEPQARVRRLAGMLARKGYPPSLAVRVVREALAGEDTEDLLDHLELEDDR